MFAPKVAKAQTKAAESSTSKLAPQPSALGPRPLGVGAVEQARMLQGPIGNQAMLRYLTQRLSNVPAKGLAERHEQEAAPENMTAREPPRGPSWDFSKIPLFPPERADQLNARSVPTSQRSSTLMSPEATWKPPDTPVDQRGPGAMVDVGICAVVPAQHGEHVASRPSLSNTFLCRGRCSVPREILGSR